MVIRVYVSNTSGNMEMRSKQDFVKQLLQVKHIDFEEVDITDPQLVDQKAWMRSNAKPKEGQANPLPPQLFNDDEYCGDYDGLHAANEGDTVNAFLKLSSENADGAGDN